jgi:phosphoribosylamine--glycine ligase
MNILLLGSGGREHAFAHKIVQSPRCGRLFIAPGNAGTAELGQNVALSPNDFAGIRRLVLDAGIGLVVVGPEEPLVNGIRDFFRADPELQGIPLVGPSREGARLEGSKAYAKAFMAENGIPTAAYREFARGEYEAACAFLETLSPPYVLKADGLAAGKGVVIPATLEEARQELKSLLDGRFGAASERVVIEEFLRGIEFSVFIATDGRSWALLPEAKDYKRVGEGDTGPNTGGMGAVSPVPFADAEMMEKVRTRIVEPTIAGLQRRGIEYRGFVFAGLMNVGGDPYVIEYNCRMGDPETEAVLPRLRTDLVEWLLALAEGRLGEVELSVDPRAAVTVVLVSGGYPGDYAKGKPIDGLDRTRDCLLFHAGTARDAEGRLVTNGGRVLAVTAFGADFREAAALARANAALVTFEGKYSRGDIGGDLG